MTPTYESPLAWSREELFERLWLAGELDWMLLPHQRPHYHEVKKWHDGFGTPAHIQHSRRLGALYDNMWVDEWGRRTGKTAFWLTYMVGAAIRFYNKTGEAYQGMFCIAEKVNIGGILVPLAAKLFDPAKVGTPKGYEPEYRSTREGLHEGFHIPAINAYIKLVGLDKDPGSTRGQWLDGCVITEAAFVRSPQLYEAVTSVIQPQFSGRKHGFIALECSTAKVKDHSFNTDFREDAILRGCYSKKTIDDNTTLTEEEKETELQRVGGRDTPAARREYFCEDVQDVEEKVYPEFSEEHHVVTPEQWPTPEHALCYVGIDPGGKQDPVGLVFFHVDFDRQKIVFTGAWKGLNRATYEIAEIVKRFELELWGTQHRQHKKPREVPPERQVLDLLKPNYFEDAPPEEPDQKVWIAGSDTDNPLVLYPPKNTLTYWSDEKYSLVPNPVARTSDVAPQQILDLRIQYGLHFDSAKKGPDSRDASISNFRRLLQDDKVRIVKNGLTEDLIMQLRSGEWNDKRTDFERNASLGHLDCLSFGTVVSTSRGGVAIQDVKPGDQVWTRAGLRKVTAQWLVGERPICRVETVDGYVIEGTADHRIWTENRGWAKLASLTASDMLLTCQNMDSVSHCSLWGTHTGGTQTHPQRSTATTTLEGPTNSCIEKCGPVCMDLSQSGTTYTTLTKTHSITTSATWKRSRMVSTATSTWAQKLWQSFASTWRKRAPQLLPGTEAQKVKLGTHSTPATAQRQSFLKTWCAYGVARLFSQKVAVLSIAANNAAPPVDQSQNERHSNASCVEAGSRRLAPTPPKLAASRVRRVSVGVGHTKVYDLTVEGEHEFFANGILVHNCCDAARYAVRGIDMLRNPFPPRVRDLSDPNIAVPRHYRRKIEQIAPQMAGKKPLSTAANRFIRPSKPGKYTKGR